MRVQTAFLTGCSVVLLLTGCSGTPAPAPELPPPPLEELQKKASAILEAGGLAAAASAASASRELALNRALADGRIRLARVLAEQMDAFVPGLEEEPEQLPVAEVSVRLNRAARQIAEQVIAVRAAQNVKQAADGQTYTAAALLVLSPTEVVAQLAEDRDLLARLRMSKAFEVFENKAAAFDAWFAGQKQNGSPAP